MNTTFGKWHYLNQYLLPVLIAANSHVLRSAYGKVHAVVVEGEGVDRHILLLYLSKAEIFMQTVDATGIMAGPRCRQKDSFVREAKLRDSYFGRTFELLSYDHITNVVDHDPSTGQTDGNDQTIGVELE